jgi:hypothetical protein
LSGDPGTGGASGSKTGVQMKRLAGLIAVLTLGALVFAGKADATQPFMQRMPQGPDMLVNPFTGEPTCGFPVLLQPTAPDVSNLIIFSDGEIISRGPFVGTATNTDTAKTVKINLSGGFSFVQHSDGSVTVTSYGHVLSSLAGIIFYGHTVLEIEANGNVTSRTFNGMGQDLCAELAG